MNAETKTPGFLIDELITVTLKLNVMDLDTNRQAELEILSGELVEALDRQLGSSRIGSTINDLIKNNIECFFAQETLFECDKNNDDLGAGKASREVHKLNAKRNEFMRATDKILGVGKYSPTEKTYAEVK